MIKLEVPALVAEVSNHEWETDADLREIIAIVIEHFAIEQTIGGRIGRISDMDSFYEYTDKIAQQVFDTIKNENGESSEQENGLRDTEGS